jgi:hypothetical protein
LVLAFALPHFLALLRILTRPLVCVEIRYSWEVYLGTLLKVRFVVWEGHEILLFPLGFVRAAVRSAAFA